MLGLVVLFNITHNISKNKPPFCISMVNFNGRSVVCPIDVEWLVCVASSHVFDQSDRTDEIDR